MGQRFTRAEFYELVWSKPMTHLAKEFGLSDVALHKVCRKHDIPNPPLGWWAKKAAGKKVERIPLPKLEPGVSDTIVIAGGELRNEPEDIAKAREQARVRATDLDPAAECSAHPIVTRSAAKLRSTKPDETGLVSTTQNGFIPISVAPDSIDRIEQCLNRIVVAAQAQGFELSGKGERAAFTDGIVTIPFALKETVKRTKHVPTSEELAKEEREQKQRQRRWARNDWSAHSFMFVHRWPEWDYSPTGQVSFEFDLYLRYASQIRRSFKDGKVQRLEKMAQDIAVGLAVLAAAKREDDRRIEVARIEAEEEKRRRIEARRLAYIEKRRSTILDEALDRVKKRDRLRRLISQVASELADVEARARPSSCVGQARCSNVPSGALRAGTRRAVSGRACVRNRRRPRLLSRSLWLVAVLAARGCSSAPIN